MGYESDISTQLLRFPCGICGTFLRDPTSLERGWGPICDGKYMGGAGGAAVFQRMVEEFDVTAAAEAIRSAPSFAPTGWMEPTGKIVRRFKKGDELPNGETAMGGEIEAPTRPLNPGSLRDYWIKRGGEPDDPNAAFKVPDDVELRRTMVSNGIWYASRAVTYGFQQDVVTAAKVDPRFLVLAAVQRFARAVGLPGAADRMVNFYGAKVVKLVKLTRQAALGNAVILFEEVPDDYKLLMWNENTRRKEHTAVGPGVVRVHTPYVRSGGSQEWNRLAKENRDIFFAWEKDDPYWWRYFRTKDLRQVINIAQGAFGDRLSITRAMIPKREREEFQSTTARMDLVVDLQTGEARYVDKSAARKLNSSPRYEIVK